MSESKFSAQQNVGSPVATIPEFTYKTVSLNSGTSKEISGKGAILREVWINTAPAAAVTIKDGDNSPFIIAAGTPAGPPLFFGDVGMRTNITITHTAGAGALTFVFKSF